jgi:hypothetical protein
MAEEVIGLNQDDGEDIRKYPNVERYRKLPSRQEKDAFDNAYAYYNMLKKERASIDRDARALIDDAELERKLTTVTIKDVATLNFVIPQSANDKKKWTEVRDRLAKIGGRRGALDDAGTKLRDATAAYTKFLESGVRPSAPSPAEQAAANEDFEDANEALAELTSRPVVVPSQTDGTAAKYGGGKSGSDEPTRVRSTRGAIEIFDKRTYTEDSPEGTLITAMLKLAKPPQKTSTTAMLDMRPFLSFDPPSATDPNLSTLLPLVRAKIQETYNRVVNAPAAERATLPSGVYVTTEKGDRDSYAKARASYAILFVRVYARKEPRLEMQLLEPFMSASTTTHKSVRAVFDDFVARQESVQALGATRRAGDVQKESSANPEFLDTSRNKPRLVDEDTQAEISTALAHIATMQDLEFDAGDIVPRPPSPSRAAIERILLKDDVGGHEDLRIGDYDAKAWGPQYVTDIQNAVRDELGLKQADGGRAPRVRALAPFSKDGLRRASARAEFLLHVIGDGVYLVPTYIENILTDEDRTKNYATDGDHGEGAEDAVIDALRDAVEQMSYEESDA